MEITIMHILLIFSVIAAVIAIEIKNILSAVIALGAVGFGISLMFLFLSAPDIAITQVVVEVLSLIILIRAVVKVENMDIVGKVDNFANVIGLIFIGLFLWFTWSAIANMQPFGEPLLKVSNHYIKNFVTETGAANAVASVILDYRAYDTLGEAMVLFTSIVGALAILRKIGRKEKHS